MKLHLIEHIFGSSSEEDCASLGILAVNYKGEELVANLLNFKLPGSGANVTVSNLLRPAVKASIGLQLQISRLEQQQSQSPYNLNQKQSHVAVLDRFGQGSCWRPGITAETDTALRHASRMDMQRMSRTSKSLEWERLLRALILCINASTAAAVFVHASERSIACELLWLLSPWQSYCYLSCVAA